MSAPKFVLIAVDIDDDLKCLLSQNCAARVVECGVEVPESKVQEILSQLRTLGYPDAHVAEELGED